MNLMNGATVFVVLMVTLQVDSGLIVCPTSIECDDEDCVSERPGPELTCPFCGCLPIPRSCENLVCGKEEECFLTNPLCRGRFCLPYPRCYPARTSCCGKPTIEPCGNGFEYRWTYNSNSNACVRFRYYGTLPSPNTFATKDQCEKKCTCSCGNWCLSIPTCSGCQCYCFPDVCQNCQKGTKCSWPANAKCADVSQCRVQPICI